MTLGEKIKQARKQATLSQEQLAVKMGVSRSAVAKWETDKGLPDVDNLKAMSKLLGVSIDYLLSDDDDFCEVTLKESIDLSAYSGSKKDRKDRIIRSRYPNAKIDTLLADIKLTKAEKIVDNLLGFLTDAPFGIPEFLNQVKNLDKQYYLVSEGDKQYLSVVTDEFVESRSLRNKITSEKFEIGSIRYTRCRPKVK